MAIFGLIELFQNKYSHVKVGGFEELYEEFVFVEFLFSL